ncbi:MAG: hypothetical protein FWC89_06790 [Defluviitaleaceae bacterium]|nr:hypothetical protein [Defluviitaleaceae bacterium]
MNEYEGAKPIWKALVMKNIFFANGVSLVKWPEGAVDTFFQNFGYPFKGNYAIF